MSPETIEELENLWSRVHQSRFYKQQGYFAGPDSFYAGIQFAEKIIINRLVNLDFQKSPAAKKEPYENGSQENTGGYVE